MNKENKKMYLIDIYVEKLDIYSENVRLYIMGLYGDYNNIYGEEILKGDYDNDFKTLGINIKKLNKVYENLKNLIK